MKEANVYLIHIRDCLQRIKSYTKEGKTVFKEQTIIQDAVLRNLIENYLPSLEKAIDSIAERFWQ